MRRPRRSKKKTEREEPSKQATLLIGQKKDIPGINDPGSEKKPRKTHMLRVDG